MKIADKDEKKRILDGLIELFGQHRYGWLLFFGTGTSCEIDQRFGMPALQSHLSGELAGSVGWAEVQSEIREGKTLEQALTIGLDPSTKARIQQVAGDFVARLDAEVRDDVLLRRKEWVGTRLLKALVGRVPACNPRLPVVTPNYDMLIEYACASQRIRCTTGFQGELTRVWNWDGVQQSLKLCRTNREGSRPVVRTNQVPRVELFKVHGSINRFSDAAGHIECDLWTESVPAGFSRVIAAPGEQKYEQYAGNMDTAAKAREAESQAMAFMVMGYGFNDHLLHQPIIARVRAQNCPLVILTRELREDERQRLSSCGKHVWVLVDGDMGKTGGRSERTLVFPPENGDGLVLEDERLWDCRSFAQRLLAPNGFL